MRRLTKQNGYRKCLQSATEPKPLGIRTLASIAPRDTGAAGDSLGALGRPDYHDLAILNAGNGQVLRMMKETWFSTSLPLGSADGIGTGQFGDRKPIDERKLRLGKSASIPLKTLDHGIVAHILIYSNQNPSRTTTYSPRNTSTARPSFSTDNASLIPIHASPFAKRFRSNCIHRSIMDLSSRMGSCAGSR